MELQCNGYTLEGYSRSTIETYVKVKELNIVFDIGKCPMPLVFVPQVFISHFHGDHSLGLTYYIAHRNLAKLEPGKIYIPASTLEAVEHLIQQQAYLEGARRNYELIPVEPGMEVPFRRNMSMRIFQTYHRIPSVGYQVIEKRNKLKAEYSHLSQKELVALKQQGQEIIYPVEIPLMTYIGDSTVDVFEKHPQVGDSEILLTECTFLAPEHYAEAEKRKHIHLDDLLTFLPKIRSKYIILMHFSMRYTYQEIKHYIQSKVPAEERERILLLL